MTDHLCAEARNYMQRMMKLDHPVDLPADLLAHIVGCAVCRGVLLTLRATAVADPGALSTLSCDECFELLPAYIDLEEQLGTAAAIHAYPQVAWHLWLCADCAEEYRLIRTLVQSSELGPIPAGAPAPTQAARLIARIQLARHRLRELLSVPTAQLGMARGPAAELVVVQTYETAEYMLTLAIQQHTGETASLVVSIDPPISGSVLLTIDGEQQRLVFQSGRAISAPIALARLLDADSADLIAAIEIVDS